MHRCSTFRSILPSAIHSYVIPFSATKQTITLSCHTFKLVNSYSVNTAVFFFLTKPSAKQHWHNHISPFALWTTLFFMFELCIHTHMTCLTYCNQAQLLSTSASPFDLLSSQILDQRSVSTRLMKIRIQFWSSCAPSLPFYGVSLCAMFRQDSDWTRI